MQLLSTEVVDAAQACSSGQTESASVDNRKETVIENVAVTVIASDDPIGDNLDLVPARKRAKRDNSVPWMAHIQVFEICTLFFFVGANVYCQSRVGVRGEAPPQNKRNGFWDHRLA